MGKTFLTQSVNLRQHIYNESTLRFFKLLLKHAQSGRSIIGMLGVVAIIGILFASGVKVYSKAYSFS